MPERTRGVNMIEVVFNDSACSSLKMAQNYGEGMFRNGTISVIVSNTDGSKPTEEEIQAAQREAEEKVLLEWKNAVPMGGNPADVYCFSFSLSIGDISESIPGEKRIQVLEWLYSIYPNLEGDPAYIVSMMQRAKDVLKEVCSRISAGESVRIWYSNQPDELCGMYWFMAQLNQMELQSGQVILVLLPDQEVDEDGNVVNHLGWGSVKLGEWHRHLNLQKAATSVFCKRCTAHWERLRQENAPLRVMLNGRLVSAQETLYDDFISREITAAADEFNEAMLIGRVLGENMLGIGDAWITHRIENMICSGSLIPVTEPAHDSPVYHRMLKKCGNNKGCSSQPSYLHQYMDKAVTNNNLC